MKEQYKFFNNAFKKIKYLGDLKELINQIILFRRNLVQMEEKEIHGIISQVDELTNKCYELQESLIEKLAGKKQNDGKTNNKQSPTISSSNGG
ncbi:MAG: hypothetical protein PVI75_05660 [Gammaproteobacteria bacterium]|jgi:hypothetical protein